jgi:hypothetical protein
MNTRPTFVTKSIKLIFWITLGGVILMFAFLIFLFSQDGQEQFSVLWKLGRVITIQQTSVELIPKSPETVNPQIGTNLLAISFKSTNPTWRTLTIGYFFALAAFALTVTFLMQRIAQSVETGRAFSIENRNRIRWLGALIVLTVPAQWLANAFMMWILRRHFDFITSEFPVAIAFPPDLAYQNIFFGLVVFMIAEVFQQGVKMQSENDLTI